MYVTKSEQFICSPYILATSETPTEYQINHFVKTMSSGSAALDMTVVSDPAWTRNKPTDQEELNAAFAKGASTQKRHK